MSSRKNKPTESLKAQIDAQPHVRRDAIIALQTAMTNPGHFSVLVTGDHGSGKSHWIERIAENKKEEDKDNNHTMPMVIINSFLAEASQEFWEEKFKEADGGYLIIERIEEIDQKSQHILFEGLSTKSGQFGFRNKAYSFTPIFTSCLDIVVIRNRELLFPFFFDRICQIPVHLPSLAEAPNAIGADFNVAWEAMKFEDKLPMGQFYEWLTKNTGKLNGNFRDLQKIAIQWMHYRRMGLREEDILSKISDGFLDRSSHPQENLPAEDHYFLFESGISHEQMFKSFRKKLKAWAKGEYGNLKNAAQKLKINPRTFSRW